MGLYNKSDRDRFAIVGRFENKIKILEGEIENIGKSNNVINDLTVSQTTTFSSQKISDTAQMLSKLVDGMINNIESSIGLDSNGSYIQSRSSNYISKATSLAVADEILDSQIKINADELNNKFDKKVNKASNVSEIVDPLTATATDASNKINEVIQALIAAGLMA